MHCLPHRHSVKHLMCAIDVDVDVEDTGVPSIASHGLPQIAAHSMVAQHRWTTEGSTTFPRKSGHGSATRGSTRNRRGCSVTG
jgi:hypothetical protein